MQHAYEGETVDVCVELISIDGELERALSFTLEIYNGTADCKL